jgi:hypothetical protein
MAKVKRSKRPGIRQVKHKAYIKYLNRCRNLDGCRSKPESTKE